MGKVLTGRLREAEGSSRGGKRPPVSLKRCRRPGRSSFPLKCGGRVKAGQVPGEAPGGHVRETAPPVRPLLKRGGGRRGAGRPGPGRGAAGGSMSPPRRCCRCPSAVTPWKTADGYRRHLCRGDRRAEGGGPAAGSPAATSPTRKPGPRQPNRRLAGGQPAAGAAGRGTVGGGAAVFGFGA